MHEDNLIFSAAKFPFQEALSLVGIDFPLFTAMQNDTQHSSIYHTPTEIQRSLFFPQGVYHIITEGMRRAVTGSRGTARPSIMRIGPQRDSSSVSIAVRLASGCDVAHIAWRA